MLIESVEQYKYQTRANQPLGAGPGYDIANHPRANQPLGVSPGSHTSCGACRSDNNPSQPRAYQPMGVSPGCCAASDVSGGSRPPTGVSRSYQVQRTGANAHRLMGLGRFDIARQGYDLSINRSGRRPTHELPVASATGETGTGLASPEGDTKRMLDRPQGWCGGGGSGPVADATGRGCAGLRLQASGTETIEKENWQGMKQVWGMVS